MAKAPRVTCSAPQSSATRGDGGRECPVRQCSKCGAAIADGRTIWLPPRGGEATPRPVCSTCASGALRPGGAKTEDPNFAGALLLGLGAAVLSALLWYAVVVLINYQLGIVAIAVGWIVAQAVVWGSGGQRGRHFQVLSVAGTLVAMTLSEYLIVYHFTALALAQQGYGPLPLLLPVPTMGMLIFEGLKSDPMTLLFWGIALWEAYTLPAVRRVPSAGP
jgi:hypothetical protein